jgi:hypothetical protein
VNVDIEKVIDKVMLDLANAKSSDENRAVIRAALEAALTITG